MPSCWCSDSLSKAFQAAGLDFAGTFVAKHDSPCTRLGFPKDGAGVFVRRGRFDVEGVWPVPLYDTRGKQCNQQGAVALLRDRGSGAAGGEDGAGRRVIVAAIHLKAKKTPTFEALRAYTIPQVIQVCLSCLPPPPLRASWLIRSVGSCKLCVLSWDHRVTRLRWTAGHAAATRASPLSCRETSTLHLSTTRTPRLRAGRLLARTPAAARVSRLAPRLCRASAANTFGRPRRACHPHHAVVQLCVVDAPEPEFTTWKFRPGPDGAPKGTKHVIDYIWHSAELTCPSLWCLPTATTIGPGALPCARYPSDHLSLAVRFAYAGL